MATATETTPSERIAEAIAENQPCICGAHLGPCPRCEFDTDGAAEIINRGIDRPLSALRAISRLESQGCMAAQDIATSAIVAFESA